MLARPQTRGPIVLLLVLSVLAELFLLAALIQSILWGYIGLLMQQSSTLLCSTYLTFKVEWLNTYLFNVIFFCGCGAGVVGGGLVGALAWLLVKHIESQEEPFPHFNLRTFYLLYILYSLALLLTIPGAGYYLTFIIEKGAACTLTFSLYWLTIGGAFMVALLLLLICWIYLFILKLRFEDRFEKPVKNIPAEFKLPEQLMVQPTMKNILDLIVMEQRLKQKNQEKSEIKEPLVESLDSDDQASVEEGDKEKIAVIGFAEYKQKQDQQRRKDEEEERIIHELIAREQAKRDEIERQEAQESARLIEEKKKKRKKISQKALSPDDEDFEKIFEDSENEEPNDANESIKDIPQQAPSKLDEPFYPANYVPVDQQDAKRFKDYKKKLLEKYNIKKPKNHKRHLQNIEGGRSKRQVQRLVNAHRKPPRTIEYYQNMLKSNYSPPTPIQEVEDSESYTHSHSQADNVSATFNFKEPQDHHEQHREQPSMMITPLQDHEELSRRDDYEAEEPPSRLLFQRHATKSPMRKKLFEEEKSYLKNMNMGSVLGTIVKGVVQSSHRTRLTQLREEREETQGGSAQKRKKNERLIDFIRSKYS